MADRRRVAIFALLVGACVAAVAVSLVSAKGTSSRAVDAKGARAAVATGRPTIVFRTMDLRDKRTFSRVAFAPVAAMGRRTLAPATCDRVAFGGGKGICLHQRGTLGKGTEVAVVDDDWRVLRSLQVDGIPSRTRVSPGGTLGALTTFVAGHAYGSPGSFSTATTLLDLAHGRTIGNLESFSATRDGAAMNAPDRNIWGVTFAADEDTFYATFATGRHHYLVRGSVRRRSLTVLRDNVECPSLSPDGTRIGYKKTVDGAWRFTVLDLRTMQDTLLAEQQPVDDQLAWLDDDHVMYGKGMDIDVVAADGSGTPRRLIANAGSPTVVGSSAGS